MSDDPRTLTRDPSVPTPGDSSQPSTLDRTADRENTPPSDDFNRTGPYVPADVTALAPPGYEILSELGRGGMGVVYQARDTRLNRVVALKMILAGGHATAADRERFLREARAAAGLKHPNVVQVYEVGEHRGLPYFTLEFVDGGPLSRHARDPLPPRAAAELVERIAGGVQAAHDRGIVHRDLKPGNVLLAADGTPKVADFGLAKAVDVGGELTASGAVLGTPSYMAPEQARGDGKHVGPAADVYALGAVLYRLLTGRPPFSAPTPLETVRQVVDADPVTPTQLVRTVPRDLETITLKCLAKEPGRRYASAAAVANDLRRWLDGRPIVARPARRAERAWKAVKRNKMLTGFVLALVAGTTVSAWQAVRATVAEQDATAQKKDAEDERDAKDLAVKNLEASRNETAVALEKLTDELVGEGIGRRGPVSDRERGFLRDVLALWEKVAAGRGAGPAADLLRAEGAERVGVIRHHLGEYADAEVAYRAALGVREPLAAAHPGVPEYQDRLAGTHMNLGLLLRITGRAADAERAYRAALGVSEPLAAAHPGVPDYQNMLAGTLVNLALLRLDGHQPAETRRLHDEAATRHRTALAAYPRNPEYRQFYLYNRHALCRALVALGEHAAVPAAAAEMLEYTAHHAPDTYDAACFLSRCVPLAKDDPALDPAKQKSLADEYADQAVAYLKRAVELGYKDAPHMWRDADLDPLRGRADFRAVLAALGATREPVPKPRPAK